jgi:signal transduction histidine kinase
MLVTTALVAVRLFSGAELLVQDSFLRLLPRRAAVSVATVLVDEPSLRAVGPWPWSRSQIGTLVDRVKAAGAAGVVIDLLLPEPRVGDEVLEAALARLPAVLAVGIDDRGGWLLPAEALRGSAQLGHVSFELDRDGVVRRFLAAKQLEGRSLPALSVAAARLLDPSWPIPVGSTLKPGFRMAGSIPQIGAAELLSGSFGDAALRGRVVFFGASAAGIGDHAVSPLSARGSPEPGVVVQAATTESILKGDLLRVASPLLCGGLAALVAALSSWYRIRSGPGATTASLAVSLLPLPLGFLAVSLLRLEFPVLSMTVITFGIAGAAELQAALRLRRGASAASRRIRDLEALSASLEKGRRDEEDARRVVAHELKTPLTSVRGLAQILSGFDLSEAERKRVAEMVIAETSRLSAMVEALLDLERLKLKDFRRQAVPVEISRLVEERVSLLRAGGGREIRASVEPGLRVLGDETLLGRVLDNLVGNALKFSPPGEPVDVALSSSSGGEVLLEVKDRGPGVSAEEQDRVFRRFSRGKDVAAVPGLGLGLALVSEVVSWHRGQVELDTPHAGGSLFRVRLPAAPGVSEEGG